MYNFDKPPGNIWARFISDTLQLFLEMWYLGAKTHLTLWNCRVDFYVWQIIYSVFEVYGRSGLIFLNCINWSGVGELQTLSAFPKLRVSIFGQNFSLWCNRTLQKIIFFLFLKLQLFQLILIEHLICLMRCLILGEQIRRRVRFLFESSHFYVELIFGDVSVLVIMNFVFIK